MDWKRDGVRGNTKVFKATISQQIFDVGNFTLDIASIKFLDSEPNLNFNFSISKKDYFLKILGFVLRKLLPDMADELNNI